MKLVDITSRIKVLGIPTREACVLIKDSANEDELPKIIIELIEYDKKLSMNLYTQLGYPNYIKANKLLENKYGDNWRDEFKYNNTHKPILSSRLPAMSKTSNLNFIVYG